jgi:hypothetical protein
VARYTANDKLIFKCISKGCISQVMTP